MPRTGTTLCHPKIGYVNVILLFCSRHLAINLPLDHFNGDNADSPPQKYQTHETYGDIQSSIPPMTTWPPLNYSKHNPSHIRRYTLPSQPFQLPHDSISSQYSQSYSPRVLQHQKQTQYSMLQIKTIPKHISTIAILLHHPFLLFLTTISKGPHKLSEEVTKHTQTCHNFSSLNNNKYFPR